jgi:hypothetical protein
MLRSRHKTQDTRLKTQVPGLSATESEQRQLMIRMEELARIEGLRENPAKVKIPSTTQALIDSKAAEDEILKKDGTVPLTQDWDIGDGRSIRAREIRARDTQGIKLQDANGNGVFVQDGGHVGIGTTDPGRKLDILHDSEPQLRLTRTKGSAYTDLQTDSSGHLTIDPSGGDVKVDAIMDFTAAMGDSGKDPTTNTPDDWLEVKIGGMTGYIPWYTAS